MHPCNSDVATRHPGLSPGVRDALADPIVQALLAADRVDPKRSRIWHGAWLPGSNTDVFDRN
jgi:hypothetical protein